MEKSFYLHVDDQYREYFKINTGNYIGPDDVILINSTFQGYPKSGYQWDKSTILLLTYMVIKCNTHKTCI